MKRQCATCGWFKSCYCDKPDMPSGPFYHENGYISWKPIDEDIPSHSIESKEGNMKLRLVKGRDITGDIEYTIIDTHDDAIAIIKINPLMGSGRRDKAASAIEWYFMEF